LRRFESMRRIAPGSFSRNPERIFSCARDLRFAFELWVALGGWFSAAGRNVCKSRIVPPGPQQECSMQTGANKDCRSAASY
jgi:hypothetical protein